MEIPPTTRTAYKITTGSTHNLTDTEEFLASLDALPDPCPSMFTADSEIVVTRAPGRLDVMGGIADYSGSLVLQLPIASAAHVALQKSPNKVLRIVSRAAIHTEQPRVFEMSFEEFFSEQLAIDYQDARRRFSDTDDHWAAYVAGAFLVLIRERGFEFSEGSSLLIESAVPEGKGVSSSAALEVAVMQAVVTAFGIQISSQELALLCQRVENLVAGAPCGVMDQMTAACGEADHLLELLCQPCDLKGTVAIPEDLQLWGIDSSIRHSVGGSDYGTVRTAAFMGYRIIADLAGLKVSMDEREGKVTVDDSLWSGYLANITPEEFERNYSATLPERMIGKDFLHRYAGITDPVTAVNPKVDYPVRKATQHPIFEHSRVQAFAEMLKSLANGGQGNLLGELMFQSHESYSNCGLGSPETDLIVSLVRESLDEGLYGARITGGGSGGTVAVLGRRGTDSVISRIVKLYHARTGHQPLVISGSSPGASMFGNLKLKKDISG